MKEQNTKVLSWIYKSYKKFTPKIAIVSLSSVAISLLYIALAFLSKNVLELATNDRSGSFTYYIIAFAVIIILQVVLSTVLSLLKTSVLGKYTIELRERLFTVLNRKKYSDTRNYHSGDILNRFTTDVDVVVANTVSLIPDLCSILSKIIGGTIALMILEWRIALLVLLFGIILPAIGRIISKKYKYLHKEYARTEGVTRSFLQECFENSIILKTFKSEAPFKNRLKRYMNDNYRFRIKRAVLTVITNISIYSFFSLGYYAVLIWGAIEIKNGNISFGVLMAFLQLISQLRAPLQNISGILPKYYAAIASAERLIELEELDNEATTHTEKIPDFQSIVGENITFYYDDTPVLKDFSFKIEKGSMTAIVGTSGIGKSTLFKLILGLYNTKGGDIKINGETNVSAATRPLFAFVPQGNMILSGSIRDNLTLYNPDIPLSEIIKACKTAKIHDYIASLEDGYDTLLTERGGGLSEGQIQRLAIARALLADTPVLLLDEATSALDKETELSLLSNIKELNNKTVILVTHRKTSIDFCDNIIEIK
ncbi:MAG: ABC transporter ATP-binding protein [Clostridia bacterium]|nr:ABC transporter ATP-binding protein [Clostridia bacterium]